MQLTIKTPQFAVYDQVLGLMDFKALSSYAVTENYQWVHLRSWQKVWRISDGFPLQGPSAYSHDAGNKGPVYPTQTELDIILKLLLNLSSELTGLIGSFAENWKAITATPYLYPAGAGLSWHGDGREYTGAYIFYVHSQWNANWGGELLIADESCRTVLPANHHLPPDQAQVFKNFGASQSFDNAYLNEKLLDTGIGQYIMPKPNRLVVMQAGQMHAVKKVDPAAGDHLRQSIAGFFLKK